MLYGLTRGENDRKTMLGTIAPVWDGNETWLVVIGVILWGAFPVVYATLVSAFYVPVIVMLLGLILRGVSFEFRNKAVHTRWLWDSCFTMGSLAASFTQGVMVGALVKGLQFTNGQYSGGVLGWFSDFSILCGAGLCLGYALLGACWLVRKCESEVRDVARRQIPILAVAVLASSILHHNDYWPFYMVSLMFSAAFGTLALSFWPYMIPFSISIEEGAAPHSTLAFMFWGEGVWVFPLMLLYTVIGYRVFRGKLGSMHGHY